jgi:hypothetical protein
VTGGVLERLGHRLGDPADPVRVVAVAVDLGAGAVDQIGGSATSTAAGVNAVAPATSTPVQIRSSRVGVLARTIATPEGVDPADAVREWLAARRPLPPDRSAQLAGQATSAW